MWECRKKICTPITNWSFSILNTDVAKYCRGARFLYILYVLLDDRYYTGIYIYSNIKPRFNISGFLQALLRLCYKHCYWIFHLSYKQFSRRFRPTPCKYNSFIILYERKLCPCLRFKRCIVLSCLINWPASWENRKGQNNEGRVVSYFLRVALLFCNEFKSK